MPEALINSLYFTQQANKCRMLAKGLDQRTAKTLLEMADEYEAKAIEMDDAAEKAATKGA